MTGADSFRSQPRVARYPSESGKETPSGLTGQRADQLGPPWSPAWRSIEETTAAKAAAKAGWPQTDRLLEPLPWLPQFEQSVKALLECGFYSSSSRRTSPGLPVSRAARCPLFPLTCRRQLAYRVTIPEKVTKRLNCRDGVIDSTKSHRQAQQAVDDRRESADETAATDSRDQVVGSLCRNFFEEIPEGAQCGLKGFGKFGITSGFDLHRKGHWAIEGDRRCASPAAASRASNASWKSSMPSTARWSCSRNSLYTSSATEAKRPSLFPKW